MRRVVKQFVRVSKLYEPTSQFGVRRQRLILVWPVVIDELRQKLNRNPLNDCCLRKRQPHPLSIPALLLG